MTALYDAAVHAKPFRSDISNHSARRQSRSFKIHRQRSLSLTDFDSDDVDNITFVHSLLHPQKYTEYKRDSFFRLCEIFESHGDNYMTYTGHLCGSKSRVATKKSHST